MFALLYATSLLLLTPRVDSFAEIRGGRKQNISMILGLSKGSEFRFRVGPLYDEVAFRDKGGELLSIPQAERYTSSDWFHNILTIPSSIILNRIQMPVLWQMIWASIIVAANFFKPIQISMKPHTLLGSALGLLLVFRTNAAYNRFWEGRKIWEKIISRSRDIARMAALYSDVMSHKRMMRIAKLTCVFPHVLREHLQGQKSSKDYAHLLRAEEMEVLETTTCNRPLLIINTLAKEMVKIPYGQNWSSRERLSLISMANKLSECVSACERLVQTPVPLHYVRHTSRFLTIWCFMLPLVIVGDMKWMTVPIAGLSTWALFGIQEIGLLIEEPFSRSLMLEVFSSTINSDVMQTVGAEIPSTPQTPIRTTEETEEAVSSAAASREKISA
mmetsp:Transcript_7489/g.11196  ORF Transcript_7489/g.11196 Transcript_7489/m.11196 type:complete len:387 (+) Transcript_7489:64-1224(+)